jgi:hypothetical protein
MGRGDVCLGDGEPPAKEIPDFCHLSKSIYDPVFITSPQCIYKHTVLVLI